MSLEVVAWLCGFVTGGVAVGTVVSAANRLRMLREWKELYAREQDIAVREMAAAAPQEVSADIDVYRDAAVTVLEWDLNGRVHRINLTGEQAAKLVHALVGEFIAGGET